MSSHASEPLLTHSSIGLTDEEVLALSVRSSRAWPSLLPTIDISTTVGAAQAAQRGARSLLARRLLDADRDLLDESLGSMIEAVSGERALLGTYFASPDLSVFPDAVVSGFYRLDDDTWVTELVTPVGIHWLASRSRLECLAVLEQVVEGTVATPTQGTVTSVDPVLCLVAPRHDLGKDASESSARMVVVKPRSIESVSLPTQEPEPAVQLSSFGEALLYLLQE